MSETNNTVKTSNIISTVKSIISVNAAKEISSDKSDKIVKTRDFSKFSNIALAFEYYDEDSVCECRAFPGEQIVCWCKYYSVSDEELAKLTYINPKGRVCIDLTELDTAFFKRRLAIIGSKTIESAIKDRNLYLNNFHTDIKNIDEFFKIMNDCTPMFFNEPLVSAPDEYGKGVSFPEFYMAEYYTDSIKYTDTDTFEKILKTKTNIISIIKELCKRDPSKDLDNI